MIFPLETIYGNLGLFLLRLAVGVIFLYHSLPKLKNPKGMASMMAMPAALPAMLGMMELLAGMAIILGVLTQLAALVLGVIMIGAIGIKVMKWHVPFSAMDKIGWEFDLILLAASIAVLLTGGGTIGIIQ